MKLPNRPQRFGMGARPLLPRSLSTTHQERRKKNRKEALERGLRRANRRTEFEARQLIVNESLRRELKLEREARESKKKGAKTDATTS